MKLSPEELEKIKQSNQAKDLNRIIKEEKIKKDKKDEEGSGGFADNDSEDGGDQNFISAMVEKKTISETATKRESVYKKLKNELGNVVIKLRNAIRPVSTEIRSLDNEVGGVEVDYKKVLEKIDKDVDVWDDRTKKIAQASVEADHKDMEENESFIHGIKTGILGKRRGKKRKHLGQVDLGKATQDEDTPPVGFIKQLTQLREDRSHERDGGISF
jgi:hypothetical protein